MEAGRVVRREWRSGEQRVVPRAEAIRARSSHGARAAEGDLTLVERTAVRNIVSNEWRSHLSTDERDLVSYVLDQTIAWGREALELTYKQMSLGIRAPEGSEYTWRLPPICISRTVFYRLLKSLTERGVFLVETVKRRFTRIRLNLDWKPESVAMTPRLAISKHRQKGVDGSSEDVSSTRDAQTDGNDMGLSQIGTTELFVNKSQIGTPLKRTYIKKTSLLLPHRRAARVECFFRLGRDTGSASSPAGRLPPPRRRPHSPPRAAQP